MLTRQIYGHAARTPDKTALVFNGSFFSYFEFASLIEGSRRSLVSQELVGGGFALLAIKSYLDAWIVGLAARGLGLTSLVLPSREVASDISLPGNLCVITTARENWPDLGQLCRDRGWRLVNLPVPKFTRVRNHGAMEMPDWPPVLGGRILMTSGTTGVGKMTLFDPLGEDTESHRRAVFEISDQSRVLVPHFGGWSSPGYNVPAHVWDAGGMVSMYQGSKPWESLQRPGITHAFATPHLLTQILSAPPRELRRNDGMRLIMTGSALLPELYEAAKARLTNQIFTTVGATEVGVFTETRVEQLDDLRWHRIVPGCDVQVVDDEGRPLDAGGIGEVRVRVLDGATGYLNDEAASREFFGDGYFYPGDLGVFRSDGRLSLRGRKVNVLNLGGDKVLPEPFEEKLVGLCGVVGACILEGIPEVDGCTLHVILESPHSIPLPKLEAALNKVLRPPFKARIHFVRALPRNHMGKVRRDELRRAVGLR